MLWIAISVFLLIITPFFVSFKFSVDSINKEAKFSVKLLNVVLLTGGKIIRNKRGISIKFSSGKVRKINILSLADVKGIIKPFMDFYITSLKLSIISFGSDIIDEYKKAFIFNSLFNTVSPYISYRKPFLRPKSNIIIGEGTNYLKVILSINILLNLFVIILTLIKSVWGIFFGK